MALFRQEQNTTLLTGWWGALAVLVNLYCLLTNVAARLRIGRLAIPFATPASESTPLSSPLDPGAPLYRRLGLWFVPIGLFTLMILAS